MCKSVVLDGDYIDDTLALSDALGVPVILDRECNWEPSPEGECLCNCDVPAMAAAAGKDCTSVTADSEDWGLVDWVITSVKQ